MNRGFIDKRTLVIIGLLVGIPCGLLLYWEISARRMREHFVKALQAGEVDGLLLELRGKTWTAGDLASVEVIRLDSSYGKERALVRLAHEGGEAAVSRSQFSYQATITNTETGVKYVFGYPRSGSRKWRCQGLHPDTAERDRELLRRGEDPRERRGLPVQSPASQ